jgi:hypothetical protein
MEETLKVFKIYFLALLLIFAFPVTAQESEEGVTEPEGSASEDADEEDKEEEGEETEAEKPAEVKPQEDAKEPLKPQAVEPEAKEEPKVSVKVESESKEEEKSEEEKEKENKKFSVSLSNGFSHGVAKERKSFAYNLTLGASYALPWQLNFSAGVGLSALYRYDMESAVSIESGEASTEKIDYGQFDGTPLTLGLSKAFPLFWEIGGSLGISAGLPFTSTELWEQYNIYTMLSVSLGLKRSFKLAKETSLSTGFGFGYTKTFAKHDYAWDDYQNSILDQINEHAMTIGLSLSLAYKDFSLAVSGGYNISRSYSVESLSFDYGDSNDTEAKKSGTVYQPWSYSFSFRVSASYNVKDWNFALGVATNAPEFESGNYTGYNTVAGDKEVINPTSNYPFKPKYTRVFANIGYSYSF